MFAGVRNIVKSSRRAVPMGTSVAAAIVQVRCINKTPRQDPHHRIRNIGGINDDGTRWKLGEDEAIAGMKASKWRFWTTTPQGNSVWVIIAVHEGREYLKTEADG